MIGSRTWNEGGWLVQSNQLVHDMVDEVFTVILSMMAVSLMVYSPFLRG